MPGAYSSTAGGINQPQKVFNRSDILWPHHAADFHAVAEGNERRPQLDAERAPQRAAGAIFDLEMLQRRVPAHMLGRVSSLDFFVSLSFMPLSMAVAGPLSKVVAVEVIFAAAGLLPIVLAVVALAAARMPRDEIAHPLN